MLQLLLERGQRYADLASVLGVDEAEVRSRAREALTGLGGVDPDRNVGLTDYLLGQADPIGRADAVRHLKDHPEDLSLATELSQKLLLVAPEADLPRLPGEERRPRPRRGGADGSRWPIPKRLARSREGGGETAEHASRATLGRHRTQLAVGAGSAGLLVLVGILAIAGVFSGGSSSPASTTTSTPTPVTVGLKPQGGGKASGSVTFGAQNEQQPVVDVTVRNLDPAPPDQAYLLWLLLTPSRGYPLPTVITPSKSGAYENRVSIPPAALAIITRLRYVNVSIAPVKTIQAAIAKGVRSRRIILEKPGTTVLQGRVGPGRAGTG